MSENLSQEDLDRNRNGSEGPHTLYHCGHCSAEQSPSVVRGTYGTQTAWGKDFVEENVRKKEAKQSTLKHQQKWPLSVLLGGSNPFVTQT